MSLYCCELYAKREPSPARLGRWRAEHFSRCKSSKLRAPITRPKHDRTPLDVPGSMLFPLFKKWEQAGNEKPQSNQHVPTVPTVPTPKHDTLHQ